VGEGHLRCDARTLDVVTELILVPGTAVSTLILRQSIIQVLYIGIGKLVGLAMCISECLDEAFYQ